MNSVKWVDRDSGMGCIEAGVVGVDLDAKLAAFVRHVNAASLHPILSLEGGVPSFLIL